MVKILHPSLEAWAFASHNGQKKAERVQRVLGWLVGADLARPSSLEEETVCRLTDQGQEADGGYLFNYFRNKYCHGASLKPVSL
jgi:hypothetical protein